MNGKMAAALVYGIGKKRLDTGARLFCVTRPSTGRSPKLETQAELAKRFRLATPEEAEPVWKDQYEGRCFYCLLIISLRNRLQDHSTKMDDCSACMLNSIAHLKCNHKNVYMPSHGQFLILRYFKALST